MESSSDEEAFLKFLILRRKEYNRSKAFSKIEKQKALIQEMCMSNWESFFKYVTSLYDKKPFRRPMFLLLPPKSIKKYFFAIFSEGIKNTIEQKWISKYNIVLYFFSINLGRNKRQTYLNKPLIKSGLNKYERPFVTTRL